MGEAGAALRARGAALLLAGLSACGAPTAADGTIPSVARPLEPERAIAGLGAALSDGPEACGECHPDALDQWRRSGHARAFTEPLFAHELAPSGSRWCSDCHAPRTSGVDRGDPSWTARAELGVDCASCHVRDGAILAGSVSGRAPHPSVASSSLSGVEGCAGCHEFTRPRQPSLAVQATVREHRESDAAARGEGCVACHMPERAPHLFPGARDEAMRRQALEVEADARPEGEGVRLTLRLRAPDAGHAVPTGDLARRLSVTARVEGAPASTERAVELGRSYEVRGPRIVEGADTRVPPRGAREVVLHLPARGAMVTWRVDLLTLPFDPSHRPEYDEATLRHPMIAGRAAIQPAPR